MIKEEASVNIETLSKNFYAYGVSHENELFNPISDITLLVSNREYGQILAKNRTQNQHKLGTSEIPTVILGSLNNANVAIWDDYARQKYGRLYQDNIKASENVDKEVLKNFIQYDGLFDNTGIEPRLFLFNKTKFLIEHYQFYVAGRGWTKFIDEVDALSYLNELFVMKDSSSFF